MSRQGTHNWLVHYIHDKELKARVRNYVHGRTIDIGCGIKPYKNMLMPYATDHIGLDHRNPLCDKSNVDIYGTAYRIPFRHNSFDSALCTGVLEHLEEPELALIECCRVLKEGGVVIYSVPFIWHLHDEPRDFFRYSKYGLKYLFEKAGFQIVEIRALSGFWVTFGQLFVYNMYRANRGLLRWFRVVALIGLLIQLVGYLLDRLDRTEQWTWMYMVVARKLLIRA